MVRSAGGPARFHKASKCVSLPARQLLSAKRATNTTVCPSRRALILGTDTRRRRRTGRWWRHWSFPHPPVFREERDARRQSNNEKRRRHEDQRVSSGRCSACFPQDVCIFPPALLLPDSSPCCCCCWGSAVAERRQAMTQARCTAFTCRWHQTRLKSDITLCRITCFYTHRHNVCVQKEKSFNSLLNRAWSMMSLRGSSCLSWNDNYIFFLLNNFEFYLKMILFFLNVALLLLCMVCS